MRRFAVAIFLAACLLFGMQPLVGKAILPWFGGSPAVWTTCLLFFQVFLLAGYAYAHASVRFLPGRRAVIVHAVLLLAALVALPIIPDASWKPTDAEDPVARILALLASGAGLPYLALAATSPLLQAWFAKTHPSESPYRLYALSNLGSLLALIGYPFLEPLLAVPQQSACFSVAFVGFAAASLVCGAGLWRAPQKELSSAETQGAQAASPSALAKALWIALPACGSALLMATTNVISRDVSVVPFLWVLPLSLYLLTFVICFHSDRWYRRGTMSVALVISALALGAVMTPGIHPGIRLQVVVYAGSMFALCMVLHGEMVRLKPAPERLTAFYLATSAGGAVGGLFVTVAAPAWFLTHIELQVSLIATLALATLAYWKFPSDVVKRLAPRKAQIGLTVVLAAISAGAGYLVKTENETRASALELTRNFYGVVRVATFPTKPPVPWMGHGHTYHGAQLSTHPRQPTTYFGIHSGIGLLLNRPHAPRSVGIVGLGVGTLAAYGQRGDRMRFYEINPEVIRLCNKHFSYVRDSAATCELVTADARLALEREEPQGFDVLVLDAFSGDAVPVHLLTREAFELYRRHIKKGGVIAVHVSSRYLDLHKVVLRAAREFKMHSVRIVSPEDKARVIFEANWVLLSDDPGRFDQPIRDAQAEGPTTSDIALWTDAHSGLLSVIR